MTPVLVTGAVLLLIGYLISVARRQQDIASAAMVAIATACAGMALASFAAVRSFAGVLDEMKRTGGGIAAVAEGVWHAATLPMMTAMAAAIVTAMALVLMLAAPPRDAEPVTRASRLWIAGVALVCGSTAVLLFRDAMQFVTEVIVPGSRHAIAMAAIPDAIAARLTNAAIGSAVCFIVAMALAIAMMRKPARATFRAAIVSLVLTLCMSAAFAASLRAYSGYYRTLYLYGPTAVASR